MFILGLTGSIGMGKSATARMFARRGIPVYDADAAVHALYRQEAVEPVQREFPDAIVDGRVDRARLSEQVVGNAERLARLEGIVHPLVRRAERTFLDRAFASAARLAVLEVPLLIETGGARRVDAVVVVSVSATVQRQRVLERGDMSEEKLDAILARQMADAEKRRHAHFIIDTGTGFEAAEKAVDDTVRALAGLGGTAYARRRMEID